ncbi:hypothetical protein CANCADRAFT_30564, partial [Tortispora caseinolytica NRRL Y-17796]
AQVLSNGARERLARIAMVKGDRARAVEDMIIRMAQAGQITRKVEENELVQLLDRLSANAPKQSSIVYQRRSTDSDDEWD